jgi:hypothetical protein
LLFGESFIVEQLSSTVHSAPIDQPKPLLWQWFSTPYLGAACRELPSISCSDCCSS